MAKYAVDTGRVRRFFRGLGKWTLILGGLWVFGTWMNSLEPESRIWAILWVMGMAIAYLDGSHKDRIQQLEWRVDDLSRRLNGYE